MPKRKSYYKEGNKTFYIKMCPKLKMWYVNSFKEININLNKNNNSKYWKINIKNKDYAIFPKKWYERININQDKIYNFIFIGGLKSDQKTFINRKWVLPFIKNKFNHKSYLQFTDKKTKKNYKKMGQFDKTLKVNGFVPKEVNEVFKNYFDKNYYNKISQSKFCLCPAGEAMYSMRFYEAIMCKSIPIVNTIDETFRSKAESKLDYKYYFTSSDKFIYKKEWADHNYELFLKYHTLKYYNINNKKKIFKTIHIFGMRRSRLHMINDIIKQKYNYKLYNNFGAGPRANNNLEGDLLKNKVINLYKNKNKDKSIFIFEDKLYNIKNYKNVINIIIIRDIYDLITSRNDNKQKAWDLNENFINTYKKILKEILNINNKIKNKIIINSDKFISDKNYRDKLLKNINITDYTYNPNKIPKFGGGATFKKEDDRGKVKISIEIINMIKKDSEFLNLVKKYYNYDIISKLEKHIKYN